MNGVAALANHGADVFIFNVSFAVGFGFPHCAALGKDFKAVAITIIINDLIYILSFTFISHDGISFRSINISVDFGQHFKLFCGKKIRARSAYSFCTAK